MTLYTFRSFYARIIFITSGRIFTLLKRGLYYIYKAELKSNQQPSNAHISGVPVVNIICLYRGELLNMAAI